MKKISILILGLLLTGCSLTTQGKAIVAANSIHDIATTESQAISAYCTPKYQAAKTQADIDATDKVCQPAEKSYYAVKAAWTSLMTVIQASKAGLATDQQVQLAADALALVLADLEKVVGGLK